MYIRPELLVASRFKAIRIVADLPYWRVKKLIAQALSNFRESFGILPLQAEDVADGWRPLLLESLRRHAEALSFARKNGQFIFGETADLGGNAPEDHGSGEATA